MRKQVAMLFMVPITSLFLAQPGPLSPTAQAQGRFTLRMHVNPLVRAFRDLGFGIVAKEIWQSQTQGTGDHVPSDSTWEIFTQLDLRLDKGGKIVSVHTISGTEVHGLAERLLGTEIPSANGADRVFGRFWLTRQPASVR